MTEAATEHEREYRSESRNSPQTLFVAPFAAFVGVFALVFGLAYILVGRSALSQRIRDEQFLSARTAVMGISAVTSGVQAELQKLARTAVAMRDDPAGFRSILKANTQSQPYISSLNVLDRNGDIVVTTESSAKTVSFLKAEPCMNEILSGAPVCFSDVRTTDSGALVAYAFVPATDDAAGVRRVMTGGMSLDNKFLDAIVVGLNPGKEGFSILVDRGGRLISSGEAEARGRARGLLMEFPFLDDLRKGKSGTTVYRYRNKKMLATYFPVEGPQWGLIVQRPASESATGVGGLVKVFFLALIVGLAGAVGISLVQTQFVTRFSFQLSTRLNAVSRGNLDIGMTHAEEAQFGNVASSFNEMVAALKAQKARDEESQADVMRTAKFSQDVLGSIQDLFLVVDSAGKLLMANPRISRLALCSEPLIGRQLAELGGTWAQRGIPDALDRTLRENHLVTLNHVRFVDRDQKSVVFDFRFYPLVSPIGGRQGAVVYAKEVTEQFTRQEKVQKSERFFRELSYGAGDAMLLIDQDMKVEWANPAAVKALGFDEEPAGIDLGAIMGDDSRGAFAGALKRTMSDGAPPAPMEIVVDQGGAQRTFEVSIGRTRAEGGSPRAVATLRPVPAKRKLERDAYDERPHLEKKIRFLVAIVDAVPEAVGVTDGNGSLLIVNTAFEKLFGAGRAALIGKNIQSFQAGGGLPDLASIINAEGPQSWELQMRPLVGSAFFALLEAAPARTETGTAVAFIAREIGRQRETDARRRAIQRQQAVEQTARDIARRTDEPLTALIAALQELGDNIFSDSIRSIWQSAIVNARTMSLSFNTLSLYATPREISYVECRMDEIIDPALEAINERGMLPPGVTVEREYEETMPHVLADEEQLKIVVWNLAMNSLQALSGGGNLLVRAVVHDTPEARGMLVEFIDDGPGFDSLEINRFFEPFYSTLPGHMGLGLPLCRRIIHRHGGRVGVDRRDNLTRVSFFIPLRPPANRGPARS